MRKDWGVWVNGGDDGQVVWVDTHEEATAMVERLEAMGFYADIEDNRPYYWVDDYRPYYQPAGGPPPLGLGKLDEILRATYAPAIEDAIFDHSKSVSFWLQQAAT